MGGLAKRPQAQELDEECPDCGAKLLLREGRWGKSFIGCSAYPKCKYLRPVESDGKSERPKAITTDIVCEKCEKPMMVRFGRKGAFLGCSGYPKCRSTRNLTDEERAKWVPAGIEDESETPPEEAAE
jgi:DNA topoisomerase-1